MRAKITITAPNPYQVPTRTDPQKGPKELIEQVNFDAEIETMIGEGTITVNDATVVGTKEITRTVCLDLPESFLQMYPTEGEKLKVIQGTFIKVRQGATCTATVAVDLGAAVC